MTTECDEVFEPMEFDPEEFCDEMLINGTIVSCELSSLRALFESFTKKQDMYFSQASETQQINEGKYIEVVADCQKQTAELANAVLERHALNPAIETVFRLTMSIRELSKQFADLREKQGSCPLLGPMFNSINEAVIFANDKCEYLGIEEISPKELDDIDPHEHEIKQTTPTDDHDNHKKIHRTLISGLKYRGKVLIPAQISAYCYKK